MEKLEFLQPPSLIGRLLGGNESEPIDYETFKELLVYFSQLKACGELSPLDESSFKTDLTKTNPQVLIKFIERSLEMSLPHPFVFLLLFEVVKTWSYQAKVTREKYSSLCDKLLKERGRDISVWYDLKRVKIICLALN